MLAYPVYESQTFNCEGTYFDILVQFQFYQLLNYQFFQICVSVYVYACVSIFGCFKFNVLRQGAFTFIQCFFTQKYCFLLPSLFISITIIFIINTIITIIIIKYFIHQFSLLISNLISILSLCIFQTLYYQTFCCVPSFLSP